MRIMIVTDAWEPQVNGVVRTLKQTMHELKKMDRQNRILLYELNKQVNSLKKRVLKGFATRSEKKKLRDLKYSICNM